MSIEDEIKQTAEKIKREQEDARRKELAAQQLQKALNDARMTQSTPQQFLPDVSLMSIINETIPSMRFDAPKVVKKMPDGITRTRMAENSSQHRDYVDEYSFDALLYSQGSGKDAISYHLWVFKNGAVAIVRNSNCNATIDEVRGKGVSVDEYRGKIIEALAQQSIKYPQRTTTKQSDSNKAYTPSSTKKQGCYIATAVYGNYDCPQVWTLRRYRDLILAKTWYGRVFINTYYKISPLLVKWFGKSKWFISTCKKYLDKKVEVLNHNGVSNSKYHDK